jgi:hypothetical protein
VNNRVATFVAQIDLIWYCCDYSALGVYIYVEYCVSFEVVFEYYEEVVDVLWEYYSCL